MESVLRKARPLVWALAAGLIAASGASAHDQFKFVNETGQAIAGLWVVDPLGGDNQLYGAIAPGEIAIINDETGTCRLDMTAVFADGSVYEIGPVGICGSTARFTYKPVNRGVPLCPGDHRCRS